MRVLIYYLSLAWFSQEVLEILQDSQYLYFKDLAIRLLINIMKVDEML